MASKANYLLMIVFIILCIITGVLLLNKTNTNAYKAEGFQTGSGLPANPTISFCPKFAPEVQTAKGTTDCCEGDFIDGKCRGKTFCTQSPEHNGIKTCVVAWKEYFRDKGIQLCPATMPNYYEDVLNDRGNKGCSQSVPRQKGDQPSNWSAKRCVIYHTDDLNRTRADSCYVEKQRLNVVCPVVPGERTEVKIKNVGGVNNFGYYYCEYANKNMGLLPTFCGEDRTFIEYNNRMNRNWRTGSSAGIITDNLCSSYLQLRQRKELEARRAADERARRELAEKKARDEKEMREKMARNYKAMLDTQKREYERIMKERADLLKKYLEMQKMCGRR